MADAAYAALPKIGSDSLSLTTNQSVEISVSKALLETTSLGDTARTFILGLEDPVSFDLAVQRDTSDAAYSALQTAYTGGSTVVFELVDADSSTAFKANMLVYKKGANFSLDDYEYTVFGFQKTGATTTEAI